MTILENLWYGNIHPVEEFLEGNKEFKNLIRIVAKGQERFKDILSPEQTELFKKYDSAVKEMNSTAEIEAFFYDFRLGVRLIIESSDNQT